MAFVVPFLPYIFGAASALYGARQQRQASEYQAQVDEQNATLTAQQTNAEEESRRRQMALALGKQRAAAHETGFAPGGGSFLELLSRNAGEMELDVLTARYRGQLEGMGLQQDAAINRRNASRATAGGWMNAAGYLASGSMDYSASTRIKGTQYPGGMNSFYGGRGRSGD